MSPGRGQRQKLARAYRAAVDKVAETDPDAAFDIEEYTLYKQDQETDIRDRLRAAEAAARVTPPGVTGQE